MAEGVGSTLRQRGHATATSGAGMAGKHRPESAAVGTTSQAAYAGSHAKPARKADYRNHIDNGLLQ
jgi:hypothetical protein